MLVQGRSTLPTCHQQCSEDRAHYRKKEPSVRGKLKQREKRQWKKTEATSY